MVSENGWPLIEPNQLDTSPIPEVGIVPVPGLLRGDVAWLLKWVALQFNNRVAGLYTPGCWGWNRPTPIPGTNVYSNHCSGTAIDLDAPSFPWTVDAMTSAQKAACRDIVAQTEGVVVWGGEFTTKLDQMHFEISGNADDVTRIVAKLKESEVSKPTYDEVLSQFRTYIGQDPTEKQMNDYVKKDWGTLNGDLLQWNFDRRRELVSKVDQLNSSKALTSDVKGQIKEILAEVDKDIDKIGQLAK